MTVISIIVPVYNVANYLEACLNSIIKQTYETIEVIVVNDGSTDNSEEIIDRFLTKDDRIKKINKENGGLSEARNIGILEATGEYIICIDPDDKIELNMIEEMITEMYQSNSDVVCCDMSFVWETSGESKIVEGIALKEASKSGALLSTPSACNKLIKASLFKEIQFPLGKKYEDLATIPILIGLCNKISYVPKPFYIYLQREGSIIYSKQPNLDDIYFALNRVRKFYDEHNLTHIYHEELEFLFIEHLLLHHCRRTLHFENSELEIKRAFKFINQQFPDWKKNSFLSLLTKKEKMVLNLLNNELLRKIMILKYR